MIDQRAGRISYFLGTGLFQDDFLDNRPAGVIACYLNLDSFDWFASDMCLGLSQFVKCSDFVEFISVFTDQQVSFCDIVL